MSRPSDIHSVSSSTCFVCLILRPCLVGTVFVFASSTAPLKEKEKSYLHYHFSFFVFFFLRRKGGGHRGCRSEASTMLPNESLTGIPAYSHKHFDSLIHLLVWAASLLSCQFKNTHSSLQTLYKVIANS